MQNYSPTSYPKRNYRLPVKFHGLWKRRLLSLEGAVNRRPPPGRYYPTSSDNNVKNISIVRTAYTLLSRLELTSEKDREQGRPKDVLHHGSLTKEILKIKTAGRKGVLKWNSCEKLNIRFEIEPWQNRNEYFYYVKTVLFNESQPMLFGSYRVE